MGLIGHLFCVWEIQKSPKTMSVFSNSNFQSGNLFFFPSFVSFIWNFIWWHSFLGEKRPLSFSCLSCFWKTYCVVVVVSRVATQISYNICYVQTVVAFSEQSPYITPEHSERFKLMWERIQALIPVLFLKPLSCIFVSCMLASPVLKWCYCCYFFSCRLFEKYS